MTTITANVTRMFDYIAPEYVSGSQAELGDQAGRLTWDNALRIADAHERWLLCGVDLACEGVREMAGGMGAWEDNEIAAWSERECLAFFVQSVASEIRTSLGADTDFEGIPDVYENTDWELECEYPIGCYSRGGVNATAPHDVMVSYCTGV